MLIVLTVREVAEWLKLSTETVQILTREGEIPHLRASPRAVRYSVAALNEWVEPTNSPVQVESLPPLFTLQEIAKEMALSVQFIRVRILSGEIKAIRVGGSWRVTERQYNVWLNSLSA